MAGEMAFSLPFHVTGAAVGVMSFTGYMPEISFAAIAGRILDADPGLGGHLDYFRFLAAIAAGGVIVAVWLPWRKRNKSRQPAVS